MKLTWETGTDPGPGMGTDKTGLLSPDALFGKHVLARWTTAKSRTKRQALGPSKSNRLELQALPTLLNFSVSVSVTCRVHINYVESCCCSRGVVRVQTKQCLPDGLNSFH